LIAAIALQQVQSLRRQKLFVGLLSMFMVMTALAGLIGWSSHQTILRVYNEAVQLLKVEGKPAPPNPFTLKPTLSLLSNMAIYVPLIGALLAVVLGHLSLVDDQSEGLGRLIFSRRVSRTSYGLGKMLGAGATLAVVLVSSLVMSAVSLLVANGTAPTLSEFVSLVLFYAVSWLYLMLFCLIGMVGVLVNRRRAMALLTALGVWLVLTFALPQITSGLRPTESLNPISSPASLSPAFFKVTANGRAMSVSEQYKNVTGQILSTSPPEPWTTTLWRVAPIALLVLGLGLLTIRLVAHHDYSKGTFDE